MNIKLAKNLIYLFAFLALVFWALSAFVWLGSRPSGSEVIFLDVGQGDGTLIKTAREQYILIDAGPTGAILDRLGRNLPFYVRRLDLVIATHPDADHIGGLPQVLRKYEVGRLLEPGVDHTSSVYKSWQEAMQERKIEPEIAQGRRIYDLGGDVALDIIYPDYNLTDKIISDNNEASIVAKFSHGQIDFLLTGDAPVSVEKRLAALYGDYLDSEVLKVGHHGSQTSSGEEFLYIVKPEVGVIQSGAGNRYGHPSSAVLRRLQKQGIFILRNDQQGDIKMKSDGERVTLVP